MAPVALLPRFDALEPDVLDNPFPTYARLREAAAVCRAGPGMWGVTRYAEVSELVRDHRLGHRFPDGFRRPFAADDGPASALLQGIVSSLEPPGHTRIRHLLSKALSPAVIRELRPYVAAETDRLLGPALQRRHFDAVRDLALPLQVSVGCELLGIPADLREEIWPRAMALGRAFIPFVPPSDDSGTADDDAVRWLRARVSDLLDERRARPHDDLLSRMLTVEIGGDRLSRAEQVDNAIFLFFAGFETSMYLTSLACALLPREPAQLARLYADRTLLPTAVEELLRYDAPIQWMARIALEPVTVGETTIRPGRVVLLLLGSANRDARQFRHPDRLDVGRRPNPHLSFGGGIHHCLGVNLARVQGAAVLDRLLSRCAAIEPAGEPTRRPHPNLRGYEHVPVAVRPAS